MSTIFQFRIFTIFTIWTSTGATFNVISFSCIFAMHGIRKSAWTKLRVTSVIVALVIVTKAVFSINLHSSIQIIYCSWICSEYTYVIWARNVDTSSHFRDLGWSLIQASFGIHDFSILQSCQRNEATQLISFTFHIFLLHSFFANTVVSALSTSQSVT